MRCDGLALARLDVEEDIETACEAGAASLVIDPLFLATCLPWENLHAWYLAAKVKRHCPGIAILPSVHLCLSRHAFEVDYWGC